MVMVVMTTGDMIVMLMHGEISFYDFFFYYTDGGGGCQNIYFCANIPREGLRRKRKQAIIDKIIESGGIRCPTTSMNTTTAQEDTSFT
jgi:hypothetical protein